MMFDRRIHWQNIYQEKSALDVSWYQKEPKLSLELIRSSKVATNDPIIDVGCGASVLVDYLIKECFTNCVIIDCGLGSMNVIMNTPNPETCDFLRIDTGLGEFTAEGLGNLNTREVDIEVGMGSADIDFRGDIERDTAWGRLMSTVDKNVPIFDDNFKSLYL